MNVMAAPNSDPKPFSYDVAPAHDATAVQEAAPITESASTPNDALALELLRGEEFDFDPRTQSIEPESEIEKPPAKWSWLWLLVALAVLYAVYTFGAVIGEKSRRPLPIVPLSAKTKASASVKVHVAGEVNKPGVYDLPFNARIQDAIRKAGGPKPDANLNALNLADWAQDGSKIEVPARDKPAPIMTPQIIIKEVPVPAAPSEAPARVAESGSGSSGETAVSESGIPFAQTESGAKSSNASVEYLTAHPVDLNTATQAQLEVLPGVGPKMAERILAYRAENGGFKSVDDLDAVKGIGEKRMATLKPLVKVR